MNARTQKNLISAMQGEAFAYVKYMLFAEKAHKDGHPELGVLFEKTANIERFEHLAEEAELAGFVGSSTANLTNAIEGESYEVDTMYREFAELATADGDMAAAKRFTEIRSDEMGHRDAYKAALIQLNSTTKR